MLSESRAGDFGNTYAGDLPSFRIDHIMVGEPLVPYQFKRIKKEYSDHYPISAQIYLPGHLALNKQFACNNTISPLKSIEIKAPLQP